MGLDFRFTVGGVMHARPPDTWLSVSLYPRLIYFHCLMLTRNSSLGSDAVHAPPPPPARMELARVLSGRAGTKEFGDFGLHAF